MRGLVLGMLLGVSLLSASARGEHFGFDLSLKTPSEETRTQSSDTDPPPEGHLVRPVAHATKGDPIVFQFFMTSNFPHDVIKNVTVRYYITPEAKAGQKTVPGRGADTVIEGHFTMDFKPNTGRVGLRQLLQIDKPGTYLVRVQSENSDTDHEHFAALDLTIDEGK